MAYSRRRRSTTRRSFSRRRTGGRRTVGRRSTRRSGSARGSVLRIVLEQPMNPGAGQVIQEKRRTF